MPLIDVIEPSGTSVFNIAFVFLMTEKHNRKFTLNESIRDQQSNDFFQKLKNCMTDFSQMSHAKLVIERLALVLCLSNAKQNAAYSYFIKYYTKSLTERAVWKCSVVLKQFAGLGLHQQWSNLFSKIYKKTVVPYSCFAVNLLNCHSLLFSKHLCKTGSELITVFNF